jgi:4-hydroxymandelate oxidase
MSTLTEIPAEIHCAQDYETLASRFIARPVYEYIAGGSGRDTTLAANLVSFAAAEICPRPLRDVTRGHTRLSLLDRELTHPIVLAPVAFHKLVHPKGELETARAAAATDSCFCAATLSTYTIEEIAQVAGPHRWFQLYFQPDRDVTLDLLRRAERAGYAGVMITLDAAVQMPSARARRAGFQMPGDCIPANLRSYTPSRNADLQPGQSRIFQGLMRGAPAWDDLDWLLAHTSLPVLAKGVLHPLDACALRDHGIAGLVVSNHGGRTLDGAPASLRALPAIRAAVGEGYCLMLDSGIRSGADVFKALRAGADAVLIGRLQLYALSVAGALGVAHMIKLLREELEVCMAMTGCASLADVRSSARDALRSE